MIEDLKEDMRKSLKAIEEKTNQKNCMKSTNLRVRKQSKENQEKKSN